MMYTLINRESKKAIAKRRAYYRILSFVIRIYGRCR